MIKVVLQFVTLVMQSKGNTYYFYFRGRLGRDLIVVGFTTTHAISVYHH